MLEQAVLDKSKFVPPVNFLNPRSALPENFPLPESRTVKDREALLDSWLDQVRKPKDPLEESRRWWHFKGAGFSTVRQVTRLVRDYHYFLEKGADHDWALEKALRAPRKDIAFLNAEYFNRSSVIWFDQELDYSTGQPLLKDSSYNSKPIVEMIDPSERGGVVLSAVFDAGKLLDKAPSDSFVVMSSPLGHSGLVSDSGKEIIYPESQTWVWHKKSNGEIEAVTLVTDMNLGQNKEFMQSLGVSEALLKGSSDQQLAENIIRNIKLIKPGMELSSFVEIAEKIQKAMGSDVARVYKDRDGSNHEVRFADLKKGLENKRAITLDETSDKFVGEFEKYVRANSHFLSARKIDDLEMVAREMGKAVLRVKMVTDGSKENPLNLPEYVLSPSEDDFRRALTQFMLIPGCFGGGSLGFFRETRIWRFSVCRACNRMGEVGDCKVCKECEELDNRTGFLSKAA